MAFLAAHPVMHDMLQALLAGSAGGTFRYRPFTAQEKSQRWPDIVAASLALSGRLPLAACRLPRELKLSDVLDASKALDAYIMELFQAAGKDAALGSRGPRVVLNPGPEADLAAFDGVISLERGQ
jgi:hypothetical protein